MGFGQDVVYVMVEPEACGHVACLSDEQQILGGKLGWLVSSLCRRLWVCKDLSKPLIGRGSRVEVDLIGWSSCV